MFYNCNYNCSYCIEGGHKNEFSKIDVNYLIETAKTINRLAEYNKIPLQIECQGGELTMIDIFPILDELKSAYIKKISLRSNMSADAEYYIKLLNRYQNLVLLASLHSSQVDELEFINKINKIYDNSSNKDIIVRTITNAENVAHYESLKWKLKCKINPCVELTNDFEKYTKISDEMLKFIRTETSWVSYGDQIISEDSNMHLSNHTIMRWSIPDFYNYTCQLHQCHLLSMNDNEVQFNRCSKNGKSVKLHDKIDLIKESECVCKNHRCGFPSRVRKIFKEKEPELRNLDIEHAKIEYSFEELLELRKTL